VLSESSYTLYFNFTQLIPLEGEASVTFTPDTETSCEQIPKAPIVGMMVPGSAITGDMESEGVAEDIGNGVSDAMMIGSAVGFGGFGVFVGFRVFVGRGVLVGGKVAVDVGRGVGVAVKGASPSKSRAVAVGTGDSIASFIFSDWSSTSSGGKPLSLSTSSMIDRRKTPKLPFNRSGP
jgi:hypothetical protein